MSKDKEQEQGKLALMAFTNNKDNAEVVTVLQGLLKMLYHLAFNNKLAIMEALNTSTEEVETVIVAVSQNGDGLDCYPILKPIKDYEAAVYAAPDNAGGWIMRTPELESVEAA